MRDNADYDKHQGRPMSAGTYRIGDGPEIPYNEYPQMYEKGRYLDAKICRICGVEIADVFRERHAAFHQSLSSPPNPDKPGQ